MVAPDRARTPAHVREASVPLADGETAPITTESPYAPQQWAGAHSGARAIRHAWRLMLQIAEAAITWDFFVQILSRMRRPSPVPT